MRTRIIVLLLVSLPLLACLDVAVSPGTPLDWLTEYPFHGPQPERGAVPIWTGRAPKTETTERTGRTMVVPRRAAEESFVVPQVQDAMSFARIITSDVTRHLPWVNPPLHAYNSRQWPEAAEYGLSLKYPPRETLDAHWFAMGIVLRHLLHPQRLTTPETEALLLRLGPQIHTALDKAGPVGSTSLMVKRAFGNIPRLPRRAPSLRSSFLRDPFLAMAERLGVAELASSYAYGLAEPFAPRCRSLGEEAVPAFTRLLSHGHSLVRENAVLLLAGFRSLRARDALLTALRSTDDVCSARALYALGNWRTPEVIRALTKRLGKRSTRVPTLQALGKIGGQRAAEVIYGDIERTSDIEVLFTGIPALGRCRQNKKEYIDFVRRLRDSLRRDPAKPPRHNPIGIFRPDQPDEPHLMSRIVCQFATIALARLGENEAREEVLKLRHGPPLPLRGQRTIAQDPLYPVLGPCTYNYLEALAELGPEGAGVLESIFRDGSLDRYVRMRALGQYSRCQGTRAETLTRFLKQVSDAVLRAATLEAIARIDRTVGRQQALAMIARFVAPRGWTSAADAGVDVVVALKIVGRTGGAEFELMRACLEAAKQLEKAARARQPRQPPPPQNRGLVASHTITVVPDLVPYALIELGRTKDRRAIPILRAHLKDQTANGRAEAALALGSAGGKEATRALIDILPDRDGWVNYCAFRGLQAMRAGHPFEDWIFASAAKKSQWLEGWEAWSRTEADTPPPLKPQNRARRTPPASDGTSGEKTKAEESGAVAQGPVETMVRDLIAAVEAEDQVSTELLRRRLVAQGTEAVSPILEAMRRPIFPVVLVDVLEDLAGKGLGLNVEAWERWWKNNRRAG